MLSPVTVVRIAPCHADSTPRWAQRLLGRRPEVIWSHLLELYPQFNRSVIRTSKKTVIYLETCAITLPLYSIYLSMTLYSLSLDHGVLSSS
jgi:hypothetical protein